MRALTVLLALLLSVTVYSQQKRSLNFLSASPDMFYDYQNYLTMLYELNGDSLMILDTLTSGEKMMARFLSSSDKEGLVFIYEENYNNLDNNNLISLDKKRNAKLSVMNLSSIASNWPKMISKDEEIVYCLGIEFAEDEIKYYGYNRELDIVEVYPNDFRKVYLNGNPGSPIKTDEKLLVYTDSIDGKLFIPVTKDVTKRPVFPVELPEDYFPNEKKRLAIYVNNDDCFMIKLDDSEGKTSNFLVLNKVTDQWNKLVCKGDRTRVQYFSDWISGTVINHDKDKISPGKADRRQEPNSFGPGFDTMTRVLKFYYPGLLFLYHIPSKAYIEWSTGQGDSEVLLVEDDLVYYRVNDQIYRASIYEGKKLGKPELLLKDNRVPDIHWAFFSDK